MLKELFSKNKNIIINTDIDGFLSGMILQKYFDCNVVGFSNSRESIWVSPEVNSIYDPIYIDLYVNRPDVICIEQHIIAYDKSHHQKIAGMGTKINPNLERKRTFIGDMGSDYYHKYPFGTVHYLVSLMAKEGINVDFGNLAAPHSINIQGRNYTTCAAQVILRADDALTSTLSRYRDNALDWWRWLDFEKSSPAIQHLIKYIDTLDINMVWKYKDDIGGFFKALGCDGIDGAFDTITDTNGNLLPKVSRYVKAISEILEMAINIPDKYLIHKGRYRCEFYRAEKEACILNDKNLYSYAFIFGPKSKRENFSYTLDME